MKSTLCNPHLCKKGIYEFVIQSYENLDSCEIDDDTATPIQEVEKDFLNAKEQHGLNKQCCTKVEVKHVLIIDRSDMFHTCYQLDLLHIIHISFHVEFIQIDMQFFVQSTTSLHVQSFEVLVTTFKGMFIMFFYQSQSTTIEC